MIKLKQSMFLFLTVLALTCLNMSSSARAETCANIERLCKADLAGASSNHGIDCACAKAVSEGGCFNSLPVSCALNYKEPGARSPGKPHLGSDIGSNGCGNKPIEVRAAADGKVIFTGTSGGSGRTIVIEHNKSCEGGGKYVTVYRHLLAYTVSQGQSVKKDDQIGIEGGSNSVRGGAPCDNQSQSGLPGYTQAGCAAAKSAGRAGYKNGNGSYAIHLHFEVYDKTISGSGGSGISRDGALKTSCPKLQEYCGGTAPEQSCKYGVTAKGACDDGTVGSFENAKYGIDAASDDAANQLQGECNFSQNIDDNSSCLFCNMFAKLFSLASIMAQVATNALSGPCAVLVSLGFGIWILLYLLNSVANHSQQSTGDMLKGILFQGFRVAVVLLALGSFYKAIINLTLLPVWQTGFEFTSILSDNKSFSQSAPSTGDNVGSASEQEADVGGDDIETKEDENKTSGGCDKNADYMQNIVGYEDDDGFPVEEINPELQNTLNTPTEGNNQSTSSGSENNTDSAKATSSVKGGGLPKSMGTALVCSIKKLEDKVGIFMSLGKYSMCYGLHEAKMLVVFPHLGYLSTGAFLWIVGMIMLLAFPWSLMDCILQLCFATALFPCAIAAYAFKITEKYLGIIWGFFMNSIFNFVFMSITVYIIVSQIQDWIGYTPGTLPNPEVFISTDLETGLAWYGVGAFKVLLILLFVYAFFGESKSMANEFASSPGVNVGGQIGGMVASAGKSMAAPAVKEGAKLTYGVLKGGAEAVGGGVNAAIGTQVRSGLNKRLGGVIARLPGARVQTNADGSIQSSEATFGIFGKRFNFSVGQGADGSYERAFSSRRRTNAERLVNKSIDENGNATFTARRQFLGFTMPGSGKEMQLLHKDAEGNMLYAAEDGKTQILVDKNGKTLGISQDGGKTFEKEYQRQESATTNTSMMKVQEQRDAYGNVVGRRFSFSDDDLQNMVRSNGQTDVAAYQRLVNATENQNLAHEAVITKHLQVRGMELENRFASRQTAVDKDGSVVIMQRNLDGSTTVVRSRVEGNQLIISTQTTLANGNIITTKSNGIQSKETIYARQDDQTYKSATRYSFSKGTQNVNNIYKPLDKDGRWGFNVDRDNAMRGFTQEDFDRHVAQLNGRKTVEKGLTLNDVKDRVNSERGTSKRSGNNENQAQARTQKSGRNINISDGDVERGKPEKDQPRDEEKDDELENYFDKKEENEDTTNNDDKKEKSTENIIETEERENTQGVIAQLQQYLNMTSDIPEAEIPHVLSLLEGAPNTPEINELRTKIHDQLNRKPK